MAQLMADKGLLLRGLSSCSAFANRLLPVPDSPVMSSGTYSREWSVLGGAHWSWDACLPAFKRLETDLDIDDEWQQAIEAGEVETAASGKQRKGAAAGKIGGPSARHGGGGAAMEEMGVILVIAITEPQRDPALHASGRNPAEESHAGLMPRPIPEIADLDDPVDPAVGGCVDHVLGVIGVGMPVPNATTNISSPASSSVRGYHASDSQSLPPRWRHSSSLVSPRQVHDHSQQES